MPGSLLSEQLNKQGSRLRLISRLLVQTPAQPRHCFPPTLTLDRRDIRTPDPMIPVDFEPPVFPAQSLLDWQASRLDLRQVHGGYAQILKGDLPVPVTE